MTASAIQYLLPELVLVLSATAIYLAGAFWPARGVWHAAAAVALLGAALALAGQANIAAGATSLVGPLAADPLALYVRTLALGVGLLLVLAAAGGRRGPHAAEQAGTLLLATAGLMLVGSAAELTLLFVALELISIPSYVLLYIGRRDVAAQEAALKYFFLSILSSAVLLYGFSFLYGVTGTLELARIRAALAGGDGPSSGLAALAVVLIVAGLGFKIAAAPFHFYAPDVYQGTSPVNAGLLAVVPKVAGMVALVRIVAVSMPGLEGLGWKLALVLSLLTMTIGNLLALRQSNVRRLLAYSSIAHAGYLLIGLAVALASRAGNGAARVDGVVAVLVYLAVYAIATTGAFAALAWLGGQAREVESLDDLAGLGRSRPLAALALAVGLFSLAGIPPLAGFWGKLTIFTGALAIDFGPDGGAVQAWFVALAVTGVLNAAVAAGYYLRIVGVMYFRAADGPAPQAAGGWGPWSAMVAAAALALVFGLVPGRLVQEADRAGRSVWAAPSAGPAAEATLPTDSSQVAVTPGPR
jgi:NADH-quinone oxidoreductase subunit N